MSLDPAALAQEISGAYATLTPIVTPSSRDAAFDVATAHAVEAELVKMGHAKGRKTAGQKVGYANKAMWRVLKLETLVWAHMFEDTVQFGGEVITLPYYRSPKIEPEIVFKMKAPLGAGITEAAAALEAV